ncbi:hypothetical protein LXL04_008782 [Taraxacum kok-saghyz]
MISNISKDFEGFDRFLNCWDFSCKTFCSSLNNYLCNFGPCSVIFQGIKRVKTIGYRPKELIALNHPPIVLPPIASSSSSKRIASSSSSLPLIAIPSHSNQCQLVTYDNKIRMLKWGPIFLHIIFESIKTLPRCAEVGYKTRTIRLPLLQANPQRPLQEEEEDSVSDPVFIRRAHLDDLLGPPMSLKVANNKQNIAVTKLMYLTVLFGSNQISQTLS